MHFVSSLLLYVYCVVIDSNAVQQLARVDGYALGHSLLANLRRGGLDDFRERTHILTERVKQNGLWNYIS